MADDQCGMRTVYIVDEVDEVAESAWKLYAKAKCMKEKRREVRAYKFICGFIVKKMI